MNKQEVNEILKFAEKNGLMKLAFTDVINEYYTTREVAEESYENFSYFDKPIMAISDSELINWYVMFKNGADFEDPQSEIEYREFREEAKKRGHSFRETVDYIDSVL